MKSPLDILVTLVSRAETEEFLTCNPKARKVGSFIEKLSAEDREILNELKSADIKNIRYKEKTNSRLTK